MPAIAIQLDVTVTIELKPNSAPVKGFCLHYVRADSSCDQDRPDGVYDFIKVESSFFASAFRESSEIRVEPFAPSFKEQDGVFQLKLDPVVVAVTSSSMPPEPLLQPGRYRLSSMQVFTVTGTQYLSAETGFPTGGTDVTIPDYSGSSQGGTKVIAVKVTTNQVPIP